MKRITVTLTEEQAIYLLQANVLVDGLPKNDPINAFILRINNKIRAELVKVRN